MDGPTFKQRMGEALADAFEVAVRSYLPPTLGLSFYLVALFISLVVLRFGFGVSAARATFSGTAGAVAILRALTGRKN